MIATTVVPAALVGHPPTVAVTEYVPAASVVTFAIVEFCVEAEKLFGPLHEYVAPEIVLAVKLKAFPEQTVLLLPAVGAEGAGLTVAVVVPAVLEQPLIVATTE